MSSPSRVREWTASISTPLPAWSQPQATVWAWGRVGLGLARSCALTAVTACRAPWWRRQEQSVRPQLREWCDEADAPRGDQRQAFDPQASLVPRLQWIVGQWQGTPLALALEATTWGTRFTVLAMSVVSRGCARPVAWTLLPATPPQAWRRAGRRLLRVLRPAIPPDGTVIVWADRGRYAAWLVRRRVRLGWHPFWRIKTGGTLRPDPQATLQPLARFVPHPGTPWHGTGPAFKSSQRRRRCTWLARGDEGYTEAWGLRTDVPPAASAACWYGLRAWIEQGFKVTKRAGRGSARA